MLRVWGDFLRPCGRARPTYITGATVVQAPNCVVAVTWAFKEMRTHFDGMAVAVQSQAHCLCIAFGGILWGPWVIHGPMMCRLFNKLKIIWFKLGALVQGDCARRAGVDSWSCTCVLHARVVRQQGQRGPGFWCPTDITVAILAQGTSWAVAGTQAFLLR